MDKEKPRLLVGGGVLNYCTPGVQRARGLGQKTVVCPLLFAGLKLKRAHCSSARIVYHYDFYVVLLNRVP